MKVNTRRKFMQKAGLATLAIGTISLPEPEKNKEFFIHHVLFYLKDKNNAQDEAKLLEGLQKLAKVRSIHYVHIGTPAGTSRPVIVKDYTFSWMCIFKNIIEQEIYQTDPIHLKFVEDYSHLWEKVVIYDAVGPKKVK